MYVREFSENGGNVAEGSGERFGIELEVENGRLPDEMHEQDYWRGESDGSLRNGGMEFISNPLSYDELDDALPMFYRWMARHRYASSVRTSTHVHLNVLDYDLTQLGAVFAAYAIVEPLLFRVCGPEREENIYCVPWYRASNQSEAAGDAIRRWRNFRLSCKYSSLHFEPVIRFGTVEFRQAPLFDTERELRLWIELLRRVVYHTTTVWDDAEAVIRAFDQGCDEFLMELFGGTLLADLHMHCQDHFESIIDDADSITIAENLVPSLCTYKVTESDWVTPSLEVEGDNARGYRNVAFRQATGVPMYEPDLDDEYYDEDYDEEEDY